MNLEVLSRLLLTFFSHLGFVGGPGGNSGLMGMNRGRYFLFVCGKDRHVNEALYRKEQAK